MMNDRQTARLFWAAKAGLVVVLVYAAVSTIVGPLRLRRPEPKSAVGSQAVQMPAAPAAVQEDPTDYSAILHNDPFTEGDGPALARASAPTETIQSADELGLTLIGVIAFAGNPSKSRAVIASEEPQLTQSYRIGDSVSSATIEDIESDRVVLRYAGHKCILMQRAGGSTTSRSAPAETSVSQRNVGRPTVPATSEPAGQPSGRLGYVENVFRHATIEPHVQDDRVDGLRISGLEQSPLAASIGLRNDDVVRRVNGQELTSKQKAFQVLQKARSQSELDIEIVRDGRTRNLSFDL